MATVLRGSIGPGGYTPPDNVTVTWRRPGAPDIKKKLNKAVKFDSPGNDSVYRRYGEGDPEVIGRQITAIGSEQLGGRAYAILKELYRQAGITRDFPTIGQEVWDFAITEGGDRPMDHKSYLAFTGKPDPTYNPPKPPVEPPAPTPPAPPAPPTPPAPKPPAPSLPVIPEDVETALVKIVQFNQAHRRRDVMDRVIMPWLLTISRHL